VLEQHQGSPVAAPAEAMSAASAVAAATDYSAGIGYLQIGPLAGPGVPWGGLAVPQLKHSDLR